MAGTRRLSIEVVGDTKGVSKAFGDVDRDAGKMSSGVTKSLGGVGLAVGGFAVAAGGAALILGPKINEMGLALETMNVKAETVFEDSIGSVRKWADENAAAMGLTATEATGLAANMADLLKPMGFTADQAATMSTEMTNLSGALSAWSGGTKSAAEVSDIMTKAMLGETDGLKQLGISIGAADVAARLAEKGQSDLTGAALAQAEALAVQELILEKSTDAQKAWADGSMDAVKASNEQKAGMNELKETLVSALYPAIQGLMPYLATATQWLGENLPKAMAVIKEWVDANWPAIRDTIVTALEFVSGYVMGFVDTVTGLWEQHGDRIMTVVMIAFDYIRATVENVLKVVQGIMDVVMGLIRGDWGEVWDGIKGILSGVWDQMKNLVETALRLMGLAIDLAWENIKGVFRSAWEGIKSTVSGAVTAVVGFVIGIPGRIVGTVTGMFSGIGDAIYEAREKVREMVNQIVGYATGLPGRMAGIFSGMWDGIKGAFRSAINWVIRAWNGLQFTVPGVSAFGKTIGGFTIGVPDIRELAQGGVVKATPGGILARIGEGGRDEAVVPLDQAGQMLLPGGSGSGARVYYIDVQVPPVVDTAAVGRSIVEAIGDFERTDGAQWRATIPA